MLKKEEESDNLRRKVGELREARNKMSERVIQLSSKLYEL